MKLLFKAVKLTDKFMADVNKTGKNLHVHDAVFKNAMSDLRVAKDFFSHHLPQALQTKINLNSLQICKGSYVDEALRELMTDMLFSVNFHAQQDEKAYLYLLSEHFSNPKRLDGWQMLKYVYSVIDDHIQKYKTSVLPVVIPIMVCNGAIKYPYSTQFCDLFGENRDLAQQYTLSQYQLIDFTQVPDEEIRAHLWSSLMQMLMKHVRSRQILTILEGLSDIFKQLATQNAEKYLLGMLHYLVKRSDISDKIRFEKFLRSSLPTPLEEKAMTLAQIWENEGFEKGMRQGINKGLQQGIEHGMQQGELRGERALLTKQLNRRFGTIPPAYLSKIETADAETLLRWGERILEIKTLEDIFDTRH